MEWTRLIRMHWPAIPWLRDPRDAADSAEEIRTAMDRNPPTNDELCATIRWLAGPEGRQEKPPSLRELIRAVYMCRKSARQADAIPGEVCPICRGRGWALVSPDSQFPDYSCEALCLCPVGEALWQQRREFAAIRANPEAAQRCQALRELARGQWRERVQRAQKGVAA